MLIPFRKLFNQATKAGSSVDITARNETSFESRKKARSKFFLEAGSANRYDAEFPARFSFAPSVRWAALPPFVCVVLLSR